MTYKERNTIKEHINELCGWLDEQDCHVASFDTVSKECEYWHEELLKSEQEVIEVTAQRDEAFKKLDEMEAKLSMLTDYLRTMQRYHRNASAYYMENGDSHEEALHDESFQENVCCEVMLMKLFEEDEPEYVERRIRMYGDMSNSYERRFK